MCHECEENKSTRTATDVWWRSDSNQLACVSVCVAAAGSKDQQRLVIGVMCPHRFVVLTFNPRKLFSCPLSLLFAIGQACSYGEQLFVQAPLFNTYSLTSLTGFGCIIPSVIFPFVTQWPPFVFKETNTLGRERADCSIKFSSGHTPHFLFQLSCIEGC